ncbi:molybdenum ABC transporter ATP-binding protein [Geomonas sp. RF6]|uniref:molybdenum ABC transporter ATP-binding protein n=1 Tax=Geomonas sp. RF6 TaxID=2897342 RepID=UPI001E2CB790|nr:molybdenum ABC transporter ATP-binding protein [Geomonas sp. RF6]UFS69163.1 molybdenum ABC transporter ATP-binding protein [Geomonas sp. RF6]
MEIRMAAKKTLGDFTLDVDFSVSGDDIGVFGQSGSGKSTLVGLIAGLADPDEGEIYLDDICLFSSKRRIALPPEKRRVSIVFQASCLFPHLSVRSNLLYGFKRCSPEYRNVDFHALVEVLKLEGLLERGVSHLSGGERQRVALGRAVLANPRLLLLDEPLSALDDTLKFQIIPYLKDVSARFRIPYLFISHSLLEMRLMADQVIAVESGRIAAHTTAEKLAREKMGRSPMGYLNLLHLEGMGVQEGLHLYRWGDNEVLLSAGDERPKALFELSSRDIILFKKHPEAISARNLLECTVKNTFASGTKVGVELSCGNRKLIAEVVAAAASDLQLQEGSELYAVVKASSFRRLD